MYIKSLNLLNFRNYNNLSIQLNKGINIFTGDNAQGKTNILESIYYCSIGKSHRTSKDKELIKWGADEAYISTYISKERLDKKIDIKIFKEGKKGININSIKLNSISDLMGVFNVVIFSPEDLKIVKESPAFRRKFIDIELCKLNKKYYYTLVQYNKVLNERNFALRKWENDKNILDIYDSQISKFASLIIKERLNYIKKLNDQGKIIHKKITSNNEFIDFEYITEVKDFDNIENDFIKLLRENRRKDLEKGITSIGPHRDDFSIFINNIDTRKFGSQGQQRTAVLSTKFASLEIIKEEIGEYPVLLLDDVLSELDLKRQKYILNSIKKVQTIITCTGIFDIKDYLDEDINMYYVKNGTVE
ncbi:DNA replication and repair protein RecF [Clostridium homopropionicum DSM 5847]|uniref:DNA replication and repair protein RecF n=1 Tax=Clostridium homopropionicum DSM 5847 TaxID=1121318 RepID=A0A0L6ZC00_9CLOT|nr:DNA replication/repair protein RecF [Clostridium homopropionicum]KOA20313.1 DNA replication and repair protein RecF [Clostridium homopropionicum DSM 5847]SFG79096.1 DNA replication and repair protein RecF [Clostridium homopropionicum]